MSAQGVHERMINVHYYYVKRTVDPVGLYPRVYTLPTQRTTTTHTHNNNNNNKTQSKITTHTPNNNNLKNKNKTKQK